MKSQDKLWNAAFINILLINFCHQMGQQMMNTLVPKYVDALGGSAYIVGLVSSIFAVSSLILRPVLVPAFDSFSKKKMLDASIFGIFTVFTCYGMAKDFSLIVVARLLHGVCVGCVAPLSLAIASESLPKDKIGKGISIFSLCQAVGQAVGPNFGLTISRNIGYSKTFYIGSAVMLLAFALTLIMKDNTTERDQYKIALNKFIEKRSLHSAVLMFFLMLPYCCVGSYLAIYGDLLGIDNIGLYFTAYAVCLLFSRPISGSMIDKYGYERVLIPGMICYAISFVLLSISRTLGGFIAAAVVSAFGYGVCYPTIQSLGMSCAPASRRGAASSTSYLGADFAMLLGPTLAGKYVDHLVAASNSKVDGYSTMYAVMIIPIALSFIYFLFTKKTIKRYVDMEKAG